MEQLVAEPADAAAEDTVGSHEHPPSSGGSGGPEQAAVYSVAILGLLSNLLLLCLILGQRRTRQVASAFVLHSAFINLLLACLTIAFGRGLAPEGIASSSCRSLTTGYIILQTVWVFNMMSAACCEIYHLDGGGGRPTESGGCVAFGIFLVYICSAIIHLGPTLIGSNFEWSASDTRCLFLHGHRKNYTAYLMWIVIVTVGLGVTAYFLVTFRRAIDRSMRSRLLTCSGGRSQSSAVAAAALVNSDPTLARRLTDLAAMKTNRQRVLCGVCGVFIICWYPLYLLVLTDPLFKAPMAVYHLFTVLGFAKAIVEPLTVAGFDRAVGWPVMKLWPCTRRLGYVTEGEIDARLSAAAAAGCHERSDSTSVIASASTIGRRQAPQPPPALRLLTTSESPGASNVFNSPSPLSFD